MRSNDAVFDRKFEAETNSFCDDSARHSWPNEDAETILTLAKGQVKADDGGRQMLDLSAVGKKI